MALKQKEKTINGVKYKVTTMDGFKALKVQMKLIKLLGSNIFSIIEKTKKEGFDISTLSPIMDNFDDKLAYEVFSMLFEKGIFIEKETENGPVPIPVNVEEHFAGNIIAMWTLAAFILEVNFALGE